MQMPVLWGMPAGFTPYVAHGWGARHLSLPSSTHSLQAAGSTSRLEGAPGTEQRHVQSAAEL